MTCPVVLPRYSKRAGEVCGASIVAFVAPGEGRCGHHATKRERIGALAKRRALRELRQLRALVPAEPDEAEDEPEACGDDGAQAPTGFDVERFAGAELDE